MGAGNSIYCAYNYDFPVEHLLKSIFILQEADGCQEEVAALKAKLQSHLNTLKESKGSKNAGGGMRYYPSGMLSNSNIFIEMDPWRAKAVPAEKRSYVGLQSISPLWYYQYKVYTKSRFTIKPYDKLDIKKAVRAESKIQKLYKETREKDRDPMLESTLKQVCDNSQTLLNRFNAVCCRITPGFKSRRKKTVRGLTGVYEYTYSYDFKPLSDEKLEEIHKLFQDGVSSYIVVEHCRGMLREMPALFTITSEMSLQDVYNRLNTVTGENAVATLKKLGAL